MWLMQPRDVAMQAGAGVLKAQAMILRRCAELPGACHPERAWH